MKGYYWVIQIMTTITELITLYALYRLLTLDPEALAFDLMQKVTTNEIYAEKFANFANTVCVRFRNELQEQHGETFDCNFTADDIMIR